MKRATNTFQRMQTNPGIRDSIVAFSGDVNNRICCVGKGHMNSFLNSKRISSQLFAFFVVTCYQTCTWDHSCSTLQREVPYLRHTHYMLPDIIQASLGNCELESCSHTTQSVYEQRYDSSCNISLCSYVCVHTHRY